MDERCVFCGADSPGGIVCPNCRDKLNDLPEDKRRVIEKIAENEQAREELRAAVADVVALVAEAVDAIASLLRRFYERVLTTNEARRSGRRSLARLSEKEELSHGPPLRYLSALARVQRRGR